MSSKARVTTEILKPDPLGIARAAALLAEGELVAFPTETVYGLGADARNGEAVARIFEAKGRPHFNPLIVHTAGLAEALTLGQFNDTALRLAKAFWPGPFTLVLPRSKSCAASELVSAGLSTIALRVPKSTVAQNLIKAAGCPVAAPSANRSGAVSPTQAAHVLADLDGRIAAVLDGGSCSVGVESTVVGFDGETPVLMRHGGIAREEIEAVIGPVVLFSDPDRPASPGQLLSHYAPAARMRLGATTPVADEAFLGFGEDAPSGHTPSLNLSPSGDLREAAANLFSFLRALDVHGCATIAVAPIPEAGLGAAINDRLNRAAEPR